MIVGLESYVLENGLVSEAHLRDTTVGVYAEALLKGGVDGLLKSATTYGFKCVVVFDGCESVHGQLSGLVQRELILQLDKNKVEFLVAPASAACQLAHLHRLGYISHVIGAQEQFLWGSAPLVLEWEVDPENAKDSVPQQVAKSGLLGSLGFLDAQFIEAALAAGCSVSREPLEPFPGVDRGNPLAQMPRFTMMAGGSLYRAIASQYSAYATRFQTVLASVYYQPFLSENGTVELCNIAKQVVPMDIQQVIGCRLSDEIYYYQKQGFVGPELLGGLVHGSLPRDNFDAGSPSVAKLQRTLAPLRETALQLLSAHMHRGLQRRPVYDQASETKLLPAPRPGMVIKRDTDSASAFTGEQLMAAAVKKTLDMAELDSAESAVESLVSRAKLDEPHSLDKNVKQAAALVLRQLCEACLVWFLVTRQAEASAVEKSAVLASFPW